MNNVVYSYRYMWKNKDSESINFKIVSDVLAGLASFEEQLKSFPDVESIAREYLHEYDCSKIGVFEPILGGEDNEKV